MNRTTIEWVRNPDGSQGFTFNPITGCLNHINGLCLGGNFPCYAYRLANGRLKQRYLDNDNIPKPSYAQMKNYHKFLNDPFYPRFWPERLRKLEPCWKSKHFTIGGASKVQPKGIFVCDMSDLFGIGIPEEWTRQVLDVIRQNRGHRFYLLTKQPQNLPQWSPFPDNCWVGVTATDSDMFDVAFRVLMRVTAKVKYISFEPLLDWTRTEGLVNPIKHLDWLIIGAQTKPYKPPKVEWVREIELAAKKADIPIFEKDNLKPLLQRELIQELPGGKT